jgi:putative transposase
VTAPRVKPQVSDRTEFPAPTGWKVSVKTVAASMAAQGLVARATRRRRSLTRPDKRAVPFPDLIRRDFTAAAINEKWCGDLTEIPTDEGKLYLATVEDLASRRLPDFALGEHHDTELAAGALKMAAATRGGDVRGVVFHSDKGGEYTGERFEATCVALGVTQSMGRVGSALDNAAAESFNSTLEWELLSRRHFATKNQARREVATFIDRYNRVRRHSTSEMRSPTTNTFSPPESNSRTVQRENQPLRSPSSIAEQFGDTFVYTNENGSLSIDKKVLAAFRKLTGDSVVWQRAGRLWRMREPSDEPGRQQGF